MPVTYEPIATTTLGSAAITITFSSVPSTYTDLVLILVASASTNSRTVWLRFNSDSGTNYSTTQLYGSGTAAGSDSTNNFSAINIAGAANMSSTIPHLYNINIFSYGGSTNKTILSTKSGDNNGSGYVATNVGLWRNTSSITSITLQCGNGVDTFNVGTTATLYGIKAA